MLNVHLDTRPIRVGEERYLSADGDGPFAVEISCFVSKPPPGGFRPCPECGRFDIQAGELLSIVASPAAFRDNAGNLQITVTNRMGESKSCDLRVLGQIVPIQRRATNPNESSGGSPLTA